MIYLRKLILTPFYSEYRKTRVCACWAKEQKLEEKLTKTRVATDTVGLWVMKSFSQTCIDNMIATAFTLFEKHFLTFPPEFPRKTFPLDSNLDSGGVGGVMRNAGWSTVY